MTIPHKKIHPRLIENKLHLLIIAFILLVGFFFRSYNSFEWFEYAHDGDLYSWIVKDIVVDKHPRLIGQLTTAPGIFIGPLFYYMLIPFFLLTRMDPVGAIIPITIIGILTVLSYYYVFSKLFNREIGLIAAFLYATLLSLVYLDRRVVPSTPTNIWLIWYFYGIVMLVRGKFSVFPLLGLLTGLIWHIHIALAPALIAIPTALLLSGKIPKLKDSLLFFLGFIPPSLPLILFEVRHNFVQTINFLSNFTAEHGGGTGLAKFNLVIIKFTEDINRLFFYPQTLPLINHTLFFVLLLLSAIFLVKKNLLKIKEVIVFYIWIGTIILFYTFSSTILSEYYFANTEIIFLTFVALLIYLLYSSGKIGKYITLALLLLLLTKNAFHFVKTDIYQKGYNERKSAAAYITEDAHKKGLPCVSVSYITTPGENVGFRYFFWLKNLHITQIQEGSATYTIVLPPELAEGVPMKLFGHIGVIDPEKIPTQAELNKSCSGLNTNLTDSLFGFTR